MSRSSNDTAEADDVNSGVSPEHVHAHDCPDSQESDVAISFLCYVQGFNYGIGALRMRNGRMGVSTRNYAYANSFPLCLKLCQHIVRIPSAQYVRACVPDITMQRESSGSFVLSLSELPNAVLQKV